MDIKETEEKVRQVDSLLGTVKNLLKKHWGLLMLILFCAFIYWAFNLPPEEETEDDSIYRDSISQQIINEEQHEDLPVDYVTDSAYVEDEYQKNQ